MRKSANKSGTFRRRILLLAVAAMAGVVGIWAGRFQRSHATAAAFAWVREASDPAGGRWRVLREGAQAEVPAGKRLDWVTPRQWEEVEGPAERKAEPVSPELELVLWAPRQQLAKLAPVASPGRGVLVRSPLGVTGYRSPVIDWAAYPDKRYDVAIFDVEDEDSPPRLARDVVPPIDTAQLETTEPRLLIPGRIYQVQVREAGNQATLGVARFLVADDATEHFVRPAGGPQALARALRGMHRRPFRTGDSSLELKSLQKEDARTELALRLRYLVALEQGDGEECDRLRPLLLK
ncbi:MAG: hypothetical protein SFV32_13285 [Opitutaceae bacterium]|nr:hypothetical protein [Opitutaceae bacterium]